MEHEHINQIMTTLAVVVEKQTDTLSRLDKINGRLGKNEEKTNGIDKIVSSQKAWASGVGVVAVFLIGILVYAYQNDKRALSAETQNVSKELSIYQSRVTQKLEQMIILLKEISPKQAEEIVSPDVEGLKAELDPKIPLIKKVGKNGEPISE